VNTVANACLTCGHDRLVRVRRYRTNTSYGPAVFGAAWIHRCERCNVAQAVPRPDPATLASYYESDYRANRVYGADVSDPARFPKDNLFYYNRGQSIAELVAPHVTAVRPRILDIGTGFGHVLHAFGERFPDSARLAIEFNDVAVDHLHSLGIEVITEPVERVLPATEHLLEPRSVLDLLHERLAPGGILYIEVPNIPTESLRRYPNNVWAPRCDEPHITFFTRESLPGLLGSAGLDVVFCETCGPEYRYISGLRFRTPPLRQTVQRLLPHALFLKLRGMRATRGLRVREREESFRAYGGFRLWIRSVSRKPMV
jgi:SAM-dependent methyltransferase